ncbi:MAG TPA: hypothetical protein VKA46_11215 [Gemmataceae bacterium]|nr:hypothetical protein [Gemmataceae bacterium]
MRRLLAIGSVVGLLFGAQGCNWSEHQCIHGRCDCDGPAYGCHYDMYSHGHDHELDHGGEPVLAPVPVGSPAEVIPFPPTEVTPKDNGK